MDLYGFNFNNKVGKIGFLPLSEVKRLLSSGSRLMRLEFDTS